MTHLNSCPTHSFAPLHLEQGFLSHLERIRQSFHAMQPYSDQIYTPDPTRTLLEIQPFLQTSKQKIELSGSLFRLLSTTLSNDFSTDITENSHKLLNVFQKKFEIFHKLHQNYDSNFRRIGQKKATEPTYSLLALALQIRFFHHSNFNDLSTALKLCDFLRMNAREKPLSQLGISALRNEIAILEELA